MLAPRSRGQAATERIAGVTVRRFWLPASSGGLVGFLVEYAVAHAQLFARGLRELLRGADVVHLHNPPDTLFPVGLLARALGRKVVFDHHDPFPELFAQKFGDLEAGGVRRRQPARQPADRHRGPLHQPLAGGDGACARGAGRPESLTVVRNGPRRSTLAGAEQPRSGELSDPHLVFVGELAATDGVLELPELLAKPGLEAATLTLVGDGGVRGELSGGLRPAGDVGSGRVHRTGRASPGPGADRRGGHLHRPGPLLRAQPPLDDDQGRPSTWPPGARWSPSG